MVITRREMMTAGLLGVGALALERVGQCSAADAASSPVILQRVPHRGLQPQVAVDGRGIVHLIHFRGDPGGGDLFYTRSVDGGTTFSEPVNVNHQLDSAVAIGNVRGAHLTIGKNGRIHVVWMGSSKARPRGPQQASPMLYTRLNDASTAFEPERNVIAAAVGLDGGGSVAADAQGNVIVAWHAPVPGTRGEENRRVWVVRSTDEGHTFAREEPVSAQATGVCGCCGMRAFADHRGTVYLLYRSATEKVHRDMYLLRSTREGTGFRSEKVDEWQTGTCPMSTAALAESPAGVLAAWETDGQVYCTRINPVTGQRSAPVAAPGIGRRRKHPVVAGNVRGEIILAWTEGMGWNRGGSLAWQVYDQDGKPTGGQGQAEGVPTWSLVGVFARPDGRFVVLH